MNVLNDSRFVFTPAESCPLGFRRFKFSSVENPLIQGTIRLPNEKEKEPRLPDLPNRFDLFLRGGPGSACFMGYGTGLTMDEALSKAAEELIEQRRAALRLVRIIKKTTGRESLEAIQKG